MPSGLSADITHIYERQAQLSRFSSTSLYEEEMLFCKILNKFVNLKKTFCLVIEDILIKRSWNGFSKNCFSYEWTGYDSSVVTLRNLPGQQGKNKTEIYKSSSILNTF